MSDAVSDAVSIDPKLAAATDLIGHTGAQSFQMRYQDDEEPVIWCAVAGYAGGRWEVAAGMTPLVATFRLCAQLIDGGTCMHCQRPTGFDESFEPAIEVAMMDGERVDLCWYQYDPELKKFRRGCE